MAAASAGGAQPANFPAANGTPAQLPSGQPRIAHDAQRPDACDGGISTNIAIRA
jgi:hypothetical protein